MTQSNTKTSPAYKVTDKTILLNIEVPFKYGAFEGTEVLQMAIYKGQDGAVSYDLEPIDCINILYSGIKMTYDEMHKHMELLKNIDIDLKQIIKDQVAAVLTDEACNTIVDRANF